MKTLLTLILLITITLSCKPEDLSKIINTTEDSTITIDTCGPIATVDTLYLLSGGIYSIMTNYIKITIPPTPPLDTCNHYYVNIYHLMSKEKTYNDGFVCKVLSYYTIEHWIYACDRPFVLTHYSSALKTEVLGPCPQLN